MFLRVKYSLTLLRIQILRPVGAILVIGDRFFFFQRDENKERLWDTLAGMYRKTRKRLDSLFPTYSEAIVAKEYFKGKKDISSVKKSHDNFYKAFG